MSKILQDNMEYTYFMHNFSELNANTCARQAHEFHYQNESDEPKMPRSNGNWLFEVDAKMTYIDASLHDLHKLILVHLTHGLLPL